MTARLLCGDALSVLESLPGESVRCCVTSPPYFGLRDYGVAGQLGLERTPDEYVARLVAVFREVRRVLTDDGTLWLNLGDSYAARGNSGGTKSLTNVQASGIAQRGWRPPPAGTKDKDLLGIPWMVAFALRADGWYLRSDIIWAKPNGMPESVKDRPTRSHEYVFLLAKSERYFYDWKAVAQPLAESSKARLAQPSLDTQEGSTRANGGAKSNGAMKAVKFGGNKRNGSEREREREFSSDRTRSGNEWKPTGSGL